MLPMRPKRKLHFFFGKPSPRSCHENWLLLDPFVVVRVHIARAAHYNTHITYIIHFSLLKSIGFFRSDVAVLQFAVSLGL